MISPYSSSAILLLYFPSMSTPDGCAMRCHTHPDCRAFSISRDGVGQCVLLSRSGTTAPLAVRMTLQLCTLLQVGLHAIRWWGRLYPWFMRKYVWLLASVFFLHFVDNFIHTEVLHKIASKSISIHFNSCLCKMPMNIVWGRGHYAIDSHYPLYLWAHCIVHHPLGLYDENHHRWSSCLSLWLHHALARHCYQCCTMNITTLSVLYQWNSCWCM